MPKLNRNNTDFSLQLLEYFKTVKYGDEYSFLKYYQNMTRKYAIDVDSGAKGVLIYHTMGMGKTLLAIAIAMDLVADMKVIILLSKSLQSNMRESIHKYARMRHAVDPDWSIGRLSDADRNKWIDGNFSFVSMNASNSLEQMHRAADDDFDEILEHKMGKIARQTTLNNTCLIVDEAHNLFRAITNGSKNAVGIYELVRASPTCRFFPMTGTPIANDPFEMVPCFNMLSKDQQSLLPESYREFKTLYVEGNQVRNRKKLQNRLLGLISHVNADSTVGAEVREGAIGTSVNMPRERETEVVRVKMTPRQHNLYMLARDYERGEGGAGGGRVNRNRIQDEVTDRTAPLQKPKSHAASTYRVKSRGLSNYAAPDEFSAEKDPRKLPRDALSSPKFEAIRQSLDATDGQRSLVYSQFVNISGLGTFAEYLKNNGWTEITANKGALNVPISAFERGVRDGRTFAVISGEVATEDRETIVHHFNDAEMPIDLVLVSASGAEGLDLKRIRNVHIMEPYWNHGRLRQIIHRAVRNDSHIDMPEEEREVAVYIYLAVPPPGELGSPTTDEELYAESIEDAILVESFVTMFREVSIECLANRGKNCHACNPTSRPLYTADYARDITYPDPCTLKREKQVAATLIEVDGVDYYYAEEPSSPMGVRIYVLDERINQYRALPTSSSKFMDVLRVIQT